MDAMICKTCNHKITENERICSHCNNENTHYIHFKENQIRKKNRKIVSELIKDPKYKRFLFFSFRGRISQPVFFKTYGTLFLLLIAIVMVLKAAGYTEFIANLEGTSRIILAIVSNSLFFLYVWVWLALQAKRVHDLGYPMFVLLIMFVPLANFCFIFWLMFVPGKKEENKYGPDPLDLPESNML